MSTKRVQRINLIKLFQIKKFKFDRKKLAIRSENLNLFFKRNDEGLHATFIRFHPLVPTHSCFGEKKKYKFDINTDDKRL